MDKNLKISNNRTNLPFSARFTTLNQAPVSSPGMLRLPFSSSITSRAVDGPPQKSSWSNEKSESKTKYSSFREDCHYSFVECQGSNLVHWSFADDENTLDKIKAHKLCSSALLIADGDIENKGERKQLYEKWLEDKNSIYPLTLIIL